jgi:transcriptional regulator with XRE-family HTH domain
MSTTRTPTNPDLGRAVRRLRRARRLTVETLAFAANIHPTYLSGIERGIRNPTWQKLCDLADALDVPVSTVVQHAGEEAEVAHVIHDTRARLATERPSME